MDSETYRDMYDPTVRLGRQQWADTKAVLDAVRALVALWSTDLAEDQTLTVSAEGATVIHALARLDAEGD